MRDDHGDLFIPAQVGKALRPIKPLSLVKRRLIESSAAIGEDGPESIAFQHTVFCQACLPFKDQLGRLSASLIRLAYTREGRGTQIDTKIVAGLTCGFRATSGSGFVAVDRSALA